MKKQRVVVILIILAIMYITIKNNYINAIGREITQNSIFSSVSEYEKKEFYYSEVHYTNSDAQYIDMIGYNADFYYKVLKKDFDIEEIKNKVNIIIHPNKEKLSTAIGIDYSEKPPVGVYFAGVINFLSPNSFTSGDEANKKDIFLKDGPIIHEMTHLFLDIKTNGNYEPWFSEGVALYYEYKYTGFIWREDLNGISDEVFPEDMIEIFKAEDEDRAYRFAFEMIQKFVKDKGEGELKKIYEKLYIGENFSDVIKAHME